MNARSTHVESEGAGPSSSAGKTSSGIFLSTLFYRNQRLLVLTIIIAIAGGVAAINSLPRLEDPRLNNRNAVVVARFPGASAERVEALVTERIEETLQEIPEIDTVESVSRAGVAVLNIELHGRITDVDSAWAKARDKLSEADLPDGLPQPELDDLRGATSYTMLLGLTWQDLHQQADGEIQQRESSLAWSEADRLALLRRLADDLKDRLQIVPGTEYVRLFGAPAEEILVTIDPELATAAGVSAQEVADRLAAADAKLPAGTLRGARDRRQVEVVGQFRTLQRISQVPITQDQHGQLLRVGDLATAEKTFRKPSREVALINGQRGVMIAARIEPGRRVDLWAEKARQAVNNFEGGLPPGIRLHRMFDQSTYTTTRLNNLAMNLLIGALVVMAAVLITMGWRSALMVGSALPLSISFALFLMQIVGLSLHQMSITGLIIALGLLIDNAIVVVDEVSRHRREGVGSEQAIGHSLQHLFVPLLGSTLTTVIAFMPIVLLTGNIGEFVGPMGISVVLALLSSFFVSMTVIPTLAGLFAPVGLRDQAAAQHKSAGPLTTLSLWLRHGFSNRWLSRWFSRSVFYAVKYPAWGLVAGLILPAMGFLVAGGLRDQFFPPADRDQFYIQVRLPPEASLEHSRQLSEQIGALVLGTEGVEAVHWLIGASAPSFYYNMLMKEDDTPNYAQALVTTAAAEQTPALVESLQSRLDRSFPGAKIVVRLLGQGPPVEAPLEFRVFGPNLAELRRLGDELRRRLASNPEVLHTRAQLQGGSPKLWVVAGEEETTRAGLDLRQVAKQLDANFEGSVGGSVLEQTEELPVRVRYAQGRRQSPDHLADLNLTVANGDYWLPLSALGDIELRPELAGIPRRDGIRCNTIQAYIHSQALPKEVQWAVQQQLNKTNFQLPPGYRLEFGGDAEEQGEAIASLSAYLSVLVLLMLTTIVLSFGSFRMAMLIVVVAVASVGMGLLAVRISGYPFGFMATIGMAGLIGVAVNDSIVVLAGIRAADPAGLADPKTITSVVLGSTRHVVSTTLTTIGGFFPLLIDRGGFWPPLAVVMAGGVAGATLVAVYFIPAGYTLTVWASRWLTQQPTHQQPTNTQTTRRQTAGEDLSGQSLTSKKRTSKSPAHPDQSREYQLSEHQRQGDRSPVPDRRVPAQQV